MVVLIPTKREREEEDFHSITTMANFLILFSHKSNDYHFDNMKNNNSSTNRVFECKTCNRNFPSFQALGGHRASHKKPRLNMRELNNLQLSQLPNLKPKTHGCSICGLEFALGQALGGHMRRHRVVMTTTTTAAQSQTSWTRLNESSRHRAVMNNENLDQATNRRIPVVKNLNGQRVLRLDLNLTPLENDHLKFNLGADCFL